jgi:hypothetical protein
LSVADNGWTLVAVPASLQTNVDMLAWFSEEERASCPYCGQRTSVGHPDAHATFCLNCGAVAIDGERVDVDGRLDVVHRRRDDA